MTSSTQENVSVNDDEQNNTANLLSGEPSESRRRLNDLDTKVCDAIVTILI